MKQYLSINNTCSFDDVHNTKHLKSLFDAGENIEVTIGIRNTQTACQEVWDLTALWMALLTTEFYLKLERILCFESRQPVDFLFDDQKSIIFII